MAINIRDKKIDERLKEVQQILINEGKIKNCSKTDVIRHLLEMKYQGKKTNKYWGYITNNKRI